MAIIGYNSIGGTDLSLTNALNHYLYDGATYTYTAAANQEVFRFFYYCGTSYGGDSSGVEMGVYDITGGTASATRVCTGTITGPLTTSAWNSVNITPVALTAGNVYAVAFRIISATNIKSLSTYSSGAVSRSNLTGSSALAASWTDNSGIGDVYSAYAETQTAAGASGSIKSQLMLLGVGA